MTNMKCKICGYVWATRVKLPKKCAKCQRWIDYGPINPTRDQVGMAMARALAQSVLPPLKKKKK